MAKTKTSVKSKKSQKPALNIYAWGHKNKKIFAGIICIILVIGLLASLLQI